jgi:hypothetical protein
MVRSISGSWAIAGLFLLFLASVCVYYAAPSLWPADQSNLEEARTPLPAGPRKYQ